MTTLFIERFANEHQVELCIDKIDNKICLFHFTGQGDDRKCDITRWGLNSLEMQWACQRFEETCAQEYQIQLDAQLEEFDAFEDLGGGDGPTICE